MQPDYPQMLFAKTIAYFLTHFFVITHSICHVFLLKEAIVNMPTYFFHSYRLPF